MLPGAHVLVVCVKTQNRVERSQLSLVKRELINVTGERRLESEKEL